MDDKLQRAVRAGLFRSRPTSEVLADARESPSMRALFSKFASMPGLKRLLLLHRNELFAVEEDIQLPFFYVTVLQDDDASGNPQAPTLQHVVTTELQRAPNGPTSAATVFGVDAAKMAALAEDLGDVLLYLLITFLRENPALLDVAQAVEFNYDVMKKTFASGAETLTAHGLAEVESIFDDEGVDIDPVIRGKVERLMIELVQAFVQNIESTGSGSPGPIPDFAMGLHLAAPFWLRRVLTRASLSTAEYVRALDELYRVRLVSNRDTIFWCEHCGLDNPAFTEHHGRVAPSKLSNRHCLNCERSESYAAIYSLGPQLKDAIFCKDGLLAVYLGSLLDTAQLDYDASVPTHNSELDFVVDEEVLIECKMYKGGKDAEGIRSDLRAALGQMAKQVEQLESTGTPVAEAYLVWTHQDWDDDEAERIVGRHQSLGALEAFDIVGPDDIEALVVDLKGS